MPTSSMNLVVSWARVHRVHGSIAIGVTIPVAVFDVMPVHGDGPASAIASLAFPRLVQVQTFFNHFELQSEPERHVAPPWSCEPRHPNRVPHFYFHFYGVSGTWSRISRSCGRRRSPSRASRPARLPEGYHPAGLLAAPDGPAL